MTPLRGAAFARHLVAIELRHSHIEDCDVRSYALGRVQGRVAVLCDIDFISLNLEQQLQAHGGIMVVVGKKDPTRGQRRHTPGSPLLRGCKQTQPMSARVNAELAPPAQAGTTGFNRTAVQLAEALHQCEPDAKAAFR